MIRRIIKSRPDCGVVFQLNYFNPANDILDGSKFVNNVTGLDRVTFHLELELSLHARCLICLVNVEESSWAKPLDAQYRSER
jgi:hypothetical protein